jgi:hypothetical protein
MSTNSKGRSTYSFDLAKKICEKLAGGNTLTEICKSKQMPASSTVRKWVLEHSDFGEIYTCAREMQAEHYADKILEIQEKVKRGEIDPSAARVSIDALRWYVSKLKPSTYGDKIEAHFTAGSGLLDAMEALGNRGLPGDNAKLIEGEAAAKITDKKRQH